MCRDNDHGGRRCPHDTSEARQARRLRARARGAHPGLVRQTPLALITEVPTTVPAPTASNHIERINELRDEIQQLNSQYSEVFVKARDYDPTRTYEVDGVTYTSASDAALALNSAIEQRVTAAGAEISELAALRSGVSETQMQEFSERESARLKAIFEGPLPELSPEQQAELADIEWALTDNDRERKAFEALHVDDYPHPTLSGFPSRLMVHLRDNPDDFEAQGLQNVLGRYEQRRRNLLGERAELQQAQREPQVAAERAYNRLNSADGPTHEELAVMMANRADAYHAILAEIRPMGGTVQMAPDSNKKAAALLQEAVQNYPSDWIEASNRAMGTNPLRVVATTRRAHYAHVKLQKKGTRAPRVYMRVQQPGFQPDPNNINDYGMEQVQPDAAGHYVYEIAPGVTHEISKYNVSEGETVWVRKSYNIAYQGYAGYRADTSVSPGRGYKKVVTSRTLNDGTVIEDINWIKPRYSEVTSSRSRVSELTIDSDGTGFRGQAGYTTALHEFGHRVEHTGAPLIARMESTFLERRREVGEAGEREKLRSIYNTGREYGYFDKFANKYMGKVYDRSPAREVLTTGMEALFGGNYGALMGTGGLRRDRDMRDFLLGLLATC